MLEHFRPGGPLALELAWQSTAALILGGSASVALARRPARAHGVLVLAMLAGLLTPLLGQGARWFGWGLLPERVGAAATGRATVAETVSRPMPVARRCAACRRNRADVPLACRRAVGAGGGWRVARPRGNLAGSAGALAGAGAASGGPVESD